MANLDKVLGILHRLAGRPWQPLKEDKPSGSHSREALLAQPAAARSGAPPATRQVRIMVRLPGEAAHDTARIGSLVASGMDIARINCARDDAAAWSAMAGSVRQVARNAGRNVRVRMDLGGPKLRAGEFDGGVRVPKIKPERDELGRVTAPGRPTQYPSCIAGPISDDASQHRLSFGVSEEWLSQIRASDRITLKNARSARRLFTVASCSESGAVLETRQTVYLVESSRLSMKRDVARARESASSDFPLPTCQLQLHRGNRVRLVTAGPGRAEVPPIPAAARN